MPTRTGSLVILGVLPPISETSKALTMFPYWLSRCRDQEATPALDLEAVAHTLEAEKFVGSVDGVRVKSAAIGAPDGRFRWWLILHACASVGSISCRSGRPSLPPPILACLRVPWSRRRARLAVEGAGATTSGRAKPDEVPALG